MTAPHAINKFRRDAFMEWVEQNGGSLAEPTNPYEVVRYKMWCDGDKSRPSTHIVYARNNGTLTYAGQSRQHYERFAKNGGAA